VFVTCIDLLKFSTLVHKFVGVKWVHNLNGKWGRSVYCTYNPLNRSLYNCKDILLGFVRTGYTSIKGQTNGFHCPC
jgi:hypothetical protein